MKMYSAAGRIYQRFGLSAIGIPYQLGLVRCVPASDWWKDAQQRRPAGRRRSETGTLSKRKPIVHFNEGDMGGRTSGTDARHLPSQGIPPETTLHDVRWGREYNGKFLWVFEISGGAPPRISAAGKTRKFTANRKSISRWVEAPARVFHIRAHHLGAFLRDMGRNRDGLGTGEVIELPDAEVEDRAEDHLRVADRQRPHPGYDTEQMMSSHMSNHIIMGYGTSCRNWSRPAATSGFHPGCREGERHADVIGNSSEAWAAGIRSQNPASRGQCSAIELTPESSGIAATGAPRGLLVHSKSNHPPPN